MNTRFNPTPNGRLHIGHLYLVLLNQHAAKRSDGKFLVRFNDENRTWLEQLGRPAIKEFSSLIREDLEWMGLGVDAYTSEHDEHDANHEFLARRLGKLEHGEDLGFPMPEIATCERPYPYTPYLTAIKVAQDCRENCRLIIRGDDLVSEFSLYCHFCRLLTIPIPRFQYVSRLTSAAGNDLADPSKTSGTFKIADYKDKGWSPEEVIDLLAKSCLRAPTGQWCYENVLPRPSLGRNRAGATIPPCAYG